MMEEVNDAVLDYCRRGSVNLSAVVSSATAVSRSYRFTIHNGGADGSSNVDHAGDFSVGEGGEAVVGEVSLGSGGLYSAELSVVGRRRELSGSALNEGIHRRSPNLSHPSW